MDDKDERQRRARVIGQWLRGKRSHELLRLDPPVTGRSSDVSRPRARLPRAVVR